MQRVFLIFLPNARFNPFLPMQKYTCYIKKSNKVWWKLCPYSKLGISWIHGAWSLIRWILSWPSYPAQASSICTLYHFKKMTEAVLRYGSHFLVSYLSYLLPLIAGFFLYCTGVCKLRIWDVRGHFWRFLLLTVCEPVHRFSLILVCTYWYCSLLWEQAPGL